jgi:dipeptidyl aminopeptidase/acylaminoacyl peptidase
MLYRYRLLVTATALIIVAPGCGVREDTPGTSTARTSSLLDASKYVPDIGTFLQIGKNFPVAVSQDGSEVFFVSGLSGADQVFRLTTEGWPYQLTTFDNGIDFFSLSNNGKMAIVGASIGGSEQSQLYLMDSRTGRLLQLTHNNNVIHETVIWAPDDRAIYYTSNEENGRDGFVYRMDIVTGESEKIFGDTAGIQGWNVAAGVSQDGSKLIIESYTSNVSNDLYLLEESSGKYRKLNDDDGDIEYYSATLMPDNTTIWMRSNGNADGIMQVAKMRVGVGSSELEFLDDGWLDPRWEVRNMFISDDYTIIAAIINEEGYQRLKLRELGSRKELALPSLDGLVDSVFFDQKGNVYISFHDPTHAPDVWRWNPGTRELKQLTFALYAGIDREIFSDPKLIHYKSFDGLEIPAFLYLPPDYKEGEAIPFLVYAHGGPESQFVPKFSRTFQYFPLNGYGILAPNPRGSSGYGKYYRDLDNYRNRKNSLKDYRAGVDWLLENGYTKPGLLGIRGGSYGGYVVLGMITEYPDLFAAAVDITGIASFKTYLTNTKPYRRKYREPEYGPLSDPEFLDSISPLGKAHLIKTPLLVLHGENDPRVPVSEARQIIRAIMSNGGEVDSLIFPDEGHGIDKRENLIASYRKEVEFLDQHLKVSKASQGVD